MPKEVIRAGSAPYGDEHPAKSVIEVRWDREAGHIQVATRCVHISDGSVYVPEWIGKQLTDAGLSHSAMLTDSSERGKRVFLAQDGWFIDLDRYGCNALIRNVRRARDQAFGRDE